MVLFGETSRQKTFEGPFYLKIFAFADFDWWGDFIADRDAKPPEAMLGVGVESELKLERCLLSGYERFREFKDDGLVLADSSEINGPSGAIRIGVEGRNCG